MYLPENWEIHGSFGCIQYNLGHNTNLNSGVLNTCDRWCVSVTQNPKLIRHIICEGTKTKYEENKKKKKKKKLY